ncbi:MAG: L-asparaginase [Dethiosulfovibrio peptidovorans]|nr:MAG: L-asparaginase [Dethiosulfovibrio peptidovorans]
MPNRGKIALVVAGGELCTRWGSKKDGQPTEVSAEEMLQWLPEEITQDVHLVNWSYQASSHYTIRMTSDLMGVMAKLVVDGIQGIVVTCGSDTVDEMSYLADLTWAYPQPVIFTGAVHPSNVMGSDAVINLYQAFLAARSQACWGAGVLICFQDKIFAASEVSLVNNHRRDCLVAVDRGPIGEIVCDDVILRRAPKRGKTLEGVTPAKNVELVQASLGGGERLLASLLSSPEDLPDGVVLGAFGNGNVFPGWLPSIKGLIKSEVPVLLTSRCPSGRVLPSSNIEGSAQRLLEIGVLDGGDLSPLKGRLKLAVAVGAGLSGDELQEYIIYK